MTDIDQHTLDFIKEHETDHLRQLALRAKSFTHIDFKFALRQIAGRQAARQKIPSWHAHNDIVYPRHISLEQSSSEQTAIYKSNLIHGDNTLIDLTGGLGVDFSFMSQQADQAIYVEKQPELVELAVHNFKVLGLKNVYVIRNDAADYLNTLETSDNIIYIDPARRDTTGKKTVFLEDCTPNLIELDDILDAKASKVIIKLSPMLDITHAVNSLKNISQVHVISVNNEVKELLFIKEKLSQPRNIHCVNILKDNTQQVFIFSKEQEAVSSVELADNISNYLYEPNASILKAGAYKSIASAFNVKKLHPNSHLYTSDNYTDNFPGRIFSVKDVVSPTKKNIKAFFRDISQANVTVRNYPVSVAEIRKQTKLREGGNDYIFATTLSDEKKVLILCTKV